eukprot:6012877-Prorocentrum_lima.AAC.1
MTTWVDPRVNIWMMRIMHLVICFVLDLLCLRPQHLLRPPGRQSPQYPPRTLPGPQASYNPLPLVC